MQTEWTMQLILLTYGEITDRFYSTVINSMYDSTSTYKIRIPSSVSIARF